ncbi:unnamed protein product [Symbiodinium microadriaticum]|nr:unnamed protein product [Symbiodinium microadriaticum]
MAALLRVLVALPAPPWNKPTPRLLCSVPPLWWRKGRPRTVHRSYAEVELLSRLVELLMPQEAIGELFRDFPVQKTDMWGSRWLCPDITAIGVLKKKHAALFVEYDGCFRHSELQAQQQDERKTAALLHYAPPGSCVLRIGHWNRGGSMTNHSSQEVVDVWRAGHEPSLMKVLQQTIRALLRRFEHLLQEDVFERLRSFEIAQPKQDFLKATTFAREADIRFMIVCRPSMLGHKYARLALRLEVLQEHNCLSKLASVISLPDATFSQRFPP